MNLDDLTIGQARALAAMFASLSPASTPAAPILHRAGEPVMIRDHLAGLFVGRLAADYVNGSPGWALAPGARKIHYWAKAAGPEGAALCGPGPGSRVCPAASRPRGGCNLIEIVGLTDEEIGATLAYPVWTP